MKSHVHRALLAGGVALSVGGGIIAASAATLGGLNSNSLGADNTSLSSCDTDGVSIAYTNTYDASGQRFQVAHAVISGINSACADKVISVELTGASGTALALSTPVTLTSSGSQTVEFSVPAVSEDITGAAVVVTG
ncbi:MAG: hypothetical protein ACO3C1_02535 [Ilumatobacteraceae bacterium]